MVRLSFSSCSPRWQSSQTPLCFIPWAAFFVTGCLGSAQWQAAAPLRFVRLTCSKPTALPQSPAFHCEGQAWTCVAGLDLRRRSPPGLPCAVGAGLDLRGRPGPGMAADQEQAPVPHAEAIPAVSSVARTVDNHFPAVRS
jgi:hypothetical protein